MGLAVVDRQTCLPFALKAACQLCVEACKRAGHDAIEFVRVGTEVDAAGKPLADTGYLAPTVRVDRCVGCGLCQTRCHSVNVRQQSLLTRSAIRVETGEENEDRLRRGLAPPAAFDGRSTREVPLVTAAARTLPSRHPQVTLTESPVRSGKGVISPCF